MIYGLEKSICKLYIWLISEIYRECNSNSPIKNNSKKKRSLKRYSSRYNQPKHIKNGHSLSHQGNAN
jgi:hypothetical protein